MICITLPWTYPVNAAQFLGMSPDPGQYTTSEDSTHPLHSAVFGPRRIAKNKTGLQDFSSISSSLFSRVLTIGRYGGSGEPEEFGADLD